MFLAPYSLFAQHGLHINIIKNEFHMNTHTHTSHGSYLDNYY